MLRKYACLLCVVSFAIPASVYGEDQLLPPNQTISGAIDHYINAKLAKESVNAAPAASDATFLRRITLDLNGRIPTISELQAYLESTNPKKKEELVDRLMKSPAFARHMGHQFTVFMQSSDITLRNRVDNGLRQYLRTSFETDKKWDQIFREVLLPNYEKKEQNGAEQFLKSRIRDLNAVTNDVSVIFFGVNVSCAQCHDHPLVKDWTQDHFYGMKSFFARTVDNGGFLAEKAHGVVKYTPNGRKEKVAPVIFLSGKDVTPKEYREPTKEETKAEKKVFDKAKKDKKSPAPPPVSLRRTLVEVALQPDQSDFFSKAIVNRLFFQFFGQGLVSPLDQMHSENAPSHPELLAWLARDTEKNGYDLHRLVRGIVMSDAYGRSSYWKSGETPTPDLFAVAHVRPLTPLQLGMALRMVGTDPNNFPTKSDQLEKQMEQLERSAEGLASLFEHPGEHFEVSITEALLFANSDRIQKEILQGNGRLVSRMMTLKSPEEKVRLAVRTVLSRPVDAEEMGLLTSYLAQRSDRQEDACQQIVWALMTGGEFRFNH